MSAGIIKRCSFVRLAFLILIYALLAASAEAVVDAQFTFSPANPMAGQPVQFTDTSTGNPTEWRWDFDFPSGTDSTLQNPVWTFNTPGTYAVKLTALVPPLDIDDIIINVVIGGSAGDLSFTQGSYSVNENAGTASIPVRRTGGSSGTVSVRCNTSNGSATAGSDYTATNDLLTWSNGDTSNKLCTIPINNDCFEESNETINLSLSNFTGGSSPGSPSSATLTIVDNDEAGQIRFPSSSLSVDETIGTVSIPVQRVGGSDCPVSVRCRTANGGTATAGADYTAINTQLNWSNGDSADKICSLPIIDDLDEEGDETVILELANPSGGATLGSPSSGIITIRASDPPPGALSFTSSVFQVNEDSGTAAVTLRRTGGSFGAVSVRCNTSNGTATAGSDYSATSATVSWVDGDTSNKTCMIPISADNNEESNETVNLSLSNFVGADQGSPMTATLTILNDDEAGNLSFTSSTYTEDEDVGVAVVTVRRTGGADGAISVRCNTSNGSATAGSDYTATTDTLTWAHGNTSNQSCTIPIINDSIQEGNETVNLSLSNFTNGATVGSPSTATLTILANDDRGELSFTASSYQANETGMASVAVERMGGSAGAVSVRCNTSNGTATAGSDYTATADILNWANGETGSKLCTIPITDDNVDESNETINLSLSNFTGGAGQGSPITAILTILDNDEAGDLSFTGSSYSVDEDGGVASITLRRTGGSDGEVTVRCNTANGTATAGSDYTATSETLTWPHGNTTNKVCSIPILDNSPEESNETINLSLSNFTGGATAGSPDTATLTINDDDEAGQLSYTSSNFQVNEDTGIASVTVRRTGGADGPVSVRCNTSDGTATSGSDYTVTTDTLNWADGDSANKICTIPIENDFLEESNETISLSLSNFSGSAGQGSPATSTLTILDDDEAGSLSFIQSSFSVNESVGIASITVRRTGGSDGPVSVRCNTSNGTATSGSDYTATTDILTWANGDSANKVCTIPITNDVLEEADETINLSLDDFNGGADGGSPATATLTIVNDDEAGNLSFTQSNFQVNEDGGSALITVRRTGGADGVVTVRCNTSDGSATSGSDYTATLETLSWSNGDSGNKTCTVPVLDDSLVEGNLTVALSLTNPTGAAAIGSPATAILTIDDDEDSGDLSFTLSSYRVSEKDGMASISVQRSRRFDGTVSVRCDTSDGTATAGSDYTTTTDILTWVEGDTTNKTCTVPVVNDSLIESSETVSLSLTNVTGLATLVGPSTATLTIDDGPGELSFTGSEFLVDEEDGIALVMVRRTGGSGGPVSIRCDTADGTATDGEDYIATLKTLTWADGDTANKICQIPIVVDGVIESSETLTVSLTNEMGTTLLLQPIARLGTPSVATLTILDSPGELNFDLSTYQVDESAGVATMLVERTLGSGGPVSGRCDTADGTALAGSDYTPITQTLTWADGDISSKQCQVSITNDSVIEGDEAVSLSLTNVSRAMLGASSTATLTISDGAGVLHFDTSNYQVGESEGTASITVQRTEGADGAASIRCGTADGTATEGSDYTDTLETLNWEAGDSTAQTCTIPILEDNVVEGAETVNLSLSDVTGAMLGTPNTATLTITDSAGELSFVQLDYTVDESASTAFITVERTGGSGGMVSVRCDTADGTAVAGSDYTTTMQTLEWLDGDTTDKTCTVPISDDSVIEGDETVSLSLTNVSGATLGVQSIATLTLTEGSGEVSFDLSNYTVDESEGMASITIQRTEGADGAASVRCETADGTATAGSDYTTTIQTLSWGIGESTPQTCTVPITPDGSIEGDETIALSLTNVMGAMLGTPNTATLTIRDGVGELCFDMSSYSVDEAAGSVSISVVRTGSEDGAASVQCATSDGTATAGVDYTATMETLNWSDGNSSAQICTVPITADSSIEGDETVNVLLTNVEGATLCSQNPVILNIRDGAGEVGFDMSSYVVDESAGVASISVERTGGSGGAVSVQCNTSSGTATGGSDYMEAMETLTWTDGESGVQTCLISILNDGLVEGNETVLLSLTHVTGAILGALDTATLTIEDDDSSGELSFAMASYTVDETAGTASITVERTGGSSGAVSVWCESSDGSATEPGDYVAVMDTLNWDNGEMGTQTCSVTIVDDGDSEGGETVLLSLTNISGAALGAQSSATLTIVDDDEAGELSFSMASFDVTEGGTASIFVQRTGGSGGMVSVQCDTANNTAMEPSDYTATMEILTWADGETGDQICMVPTMDDILNEGPETVDLSLTNLTGGAVLGTQGSATLTIIDDEVPGELSFSMASYQVAEDGVIASIAVQRTGGSRGMVSVRCDTADGTATASSDYTATMQILNWADGDMADKMCEVSILDDAAVEGGETVDLLLTSPVEAGLGMQTTATLTIVDDEDPGELIFSLSSYSVDESEVTASIMVERTGGSDGAASVRCETADGTATAGVDYTATMQVLNWSDGEMTDKICMVPVIDDAVIEGDESVNLFLTNASGAILGVQDMATLILGDGAGEVSFDMSSYTVDESAGMASILVQRTDGADGAVSVQCNTAEGTAIAGSDYTDTMEIVSWMDGESGSKTCLVPISDDVLIEDDETVLLSLTNVTGATLGTPNTATLTLVDDEISGVLRFTMTEYVVDEAAGTASIAVERTGGSGGMVSVQCNITAGTATESIDYSASPQILTWGHGDSAPQICSVTIINDTSIEGNETVLLSLDTVSGATLGTPSVATLILRDGAGEVSFDMSTYDVDESQGTLSITVERSDGADGPASVRCDTANGTATSGSDYVTTMETLTWADGDSTNKTCTVPIVDDDIIEGDETVFLSLTNVSGAALGTPNTATLNIHEGAGELSFFMSSYQVVEGDVLASIVIERTEGADGSASVRCDTSNGTATAGSDYTTTQQTLNWGDGEAGQRFCTVPITKNAPIEGDETVALSLANVTGATLGTPSTATLTIVEGPGELSFTTSNYGVDETEGTAAITIQRIGGADGVVSVQCLTANGTATVGSDYTETLETLIWADGDHGTQNCIVAIFDDTSIEGGETVSLSLDAAVGANLGTPSSATLTISDGPGELSFTNSSYQVNESAGTANITVERTDGADGLVSVRCDTADGTAIAGSDYTATADVLSWMPGDITPKICTVPIIDDIEPEADETVKLSLTNFTGARQGPFKAATLIIQLAEDLRGSLRFTQSSYEVDEDDGIASIAVERIGGSDGAVSVRCSTANGSATAGSDYTATADVLSWADGDTADKLCTIPIATDSVVESDETVSLSLANPTGGATLGTPNAATLIIANDDVGGEVGFTLSTYTVNVNQGAAQITVERTGGSDNAVSVRCETANGTAIAGIDYTATMDVLNWNSGDTSDKICTVPIIDDGVMEDDETVNLSLTNLTGGATLGRSTATLIIRDRPLFVDGFESGDVSAWSSARPAQSPIESSSAKNGVLLEVLHDAKIDCESVQLAPVVETHGSIRLKLPASNQFHLVLTHGDTVVLEREGTVHAGDIVEIVGLEMASYELIITAEGQLPLNFTTEFTSAVPCVSFELDL